LTADLFGRHRQAGVLAASVDVDLQTALRTVQARLEEAGQIAEVLRLSRVGLDALELLGLLGVQTRDAGQGRKKDDDP
jgi:hypothetical protein